jgi:hypothetical protein
VFPRLRPIALLAAWNADSDVAYLQQLLRMLWTSDDVANCKDPAIKAQCNKLAHSVRKALFCASELSSCGVALPDSFHGISADPNAMATHCFALLRKHSIAQLLQSVLPSINSNSLLC